MLQALLSQRPLKLTYPVSANAEELARELELDLDVAMIMDKAEQELAQSSVRRPVSAPNAADN